MAIEDHEKELSKLVLLLEAAFKWPKLVALLGTIVDLLQQWVIQNILVPWWCIHS